MARPATARSAARAASTEDSTARPHTVETDLAGGGETAAAWRLIATRKERGGDLSAALIAYETALRLAPDDLGILCDLARLALRLGLPEIAEDFCRRRLDRDPLSVEAADGLTRALRDQHRFSEAIDTLRRFITAQPLSAVLWNTLGTVLISQGQSRSAIRFFDEALRLDPHFSQARYNRAGARMDLGEVAQALTDCEAAIENSQSAHDVAMMRFAQATMLLSLGELPRGWEAYEARLAPSFPGRVEFRLGGHRWMTKEALSGASLLAVAEQGLGDEIMFANVVPDLLATVQPGRLSLAVEPRLVTLFGRSFPEATVVGHATDKTALRAIRSVPDLPFLDTSGDHWAPMGSLVGALRPSLLSFPDRIGYLRADPARIAYWRHALQQVSPNRKVGLTWRSGKLTGERRRCYAPFESWRDVLTTPAMTIVDLQYGDHAAEWEYARQVFGIEMWRPPGLDVRNDLDELAALSCALDLIVGCANATTNLAAACGAAVWIISEASAWPRLGSGSYPWYPQVRAFTTAAFDDWDLVLAEVAVALGRIAHEPG